MKIRGALVGGVVAAVALASLAVAAPVNVPNGDFEAGNLSKWKRFEPGGGHWFAYDESEDPPKPRGLGPIAQLPPPPQGQFAAGVKRRTARFPNPCRP